MKLAAALVTVIALSASIALAQEAPALDPRIAVRRAGRKA